ncbi:hypothetical protein Y032_0063g3464 [Ancylostoma ceylanicum]|uniref:CPSF6/7 RSLD domain-containing protein n=2 Tax=Ancylostoma ceylanicum TaxID=53326 RepID=A0A016U295_9BILA|nr:hypothetical protein Y032_0063g3464 [Ancylostoma ceylanicum]
MELIADHSMTELDQAELDLLGEGPAATDGDHLDEHALLDQTPPPGDDQNGVSRVKAEELKSEDVDLYDDAIAPSSGEKSLAPTPVRPAHQNGGTTHSDGKRYCCYIGNLVWWATDADVGLHIKALGIPDLIDMKFFENRTNGQSKGFALLVLGSDASVRTITEQMPQRQIHGQSPVILPYTKASLNRLDEATSKMQSRPDTKQSKKDEAINMGTIRIGAGAGPTGPPPMMGPRMGPGGPMGGGPMPMMQMRTGPGGPPMNMNSAPMGPGGPGPMGPGGMMNRGPVMMGQPVNQSAMMGRPMGPPGVGTVAPVQMGGPVQMGVAGQMTTGPPRPVVGGAVPMQMGQAPPMMQPGMQMQANRPPPGVQFGGGQQPVVGMGQQQMMTQGPPGVRPMNAPPQAPQQLLAPHGAHINPQMFPGVHQQPPVPGAVNDVEFEEIMNRNRTVASSAISRAVADAAGGDVKSATETILTAISLIKQSRVAHDDRCRLLVASLQDTLNGIENKAYASGGGSSRSKHRDRSRSRSRDRDRKRRRRSRSRSRSFKFKLSIAFTTTLSRSLSLNMELTVVLPFSKVCYTAIFFFKYRVFRTSRTFTFVLL